MGGEGWIHALVCTPLGRGTLKNNYNFLPRRCNNCQSVHHGITLTNDNWTYIVFAYCGNRFSSIVKTLVFRGKTNILKQFFFFDEFRFPRSEPRYFRSFGSDRIFPRCEFNFRKSRLSATSVVIVD